MNRRGAGCGCFGCGGGLLVVALLAFAAWTFVLQPARDFVAGLQLPTTPSSAPNSPTPNNSAPTSPTPNTSAPGNAALLTGADVQKFVRVRGEVRQALGPSFSDLQALWQDVQAGQTPNVFQVGAVLRQAAGDIGAARQRQAAALARENLSPQRYAEIRAGVNRALGLPTLDLAQAAQALQRGQLPDLSSSVQAATPGERALVTPYEQELRASAALGLLGL